MKANNNDDIVVRINYGLTAIFVLVMAIIAAGIMAIYPGVEKNAVKNQKIFNSSTFTYGLNRTNYVLLNETLGGTKKNNKLEKDYLDLSNIEEKQKEEAKTDFSQQLIDWKEAFEQDYRNLEYYAVNNTTKAVATNNESLKEALSSKDKDALSSNYQFYVVLQVDGKGAVEATYIKGADVSVIEHRLEGNESLTVSDYFYKTKLINEKEFNEENADVNSEESDYVGYEYEVDGNYSVRVKTDTYKKSYNKGNQSIIKPVTNMSYVYAVKTELAYYDEISSSIRNEKENYVGMISAMSILIGMALMAFITLVVPYRKERDMAASRVVIRLPIEVLGVLIFLGCTGVVFTSIVIFPSIQSGVLLTELTGLGITGTLLNVLVFSLQYISVFLCLTVAVFIMMIIKNWFHIGFFRYFRQNSLIIRAFCSVGRGIKKGVYFFTDLDLSKEGNKKLFLIVAAHGAIVFVLCCMWFFGAFLAIGYTILVFIIARKKYEKIQRDYQTLSEKTKTIANGNLETTIDEELGFFNPLKEDINNIKNGLKNAVEQEVKSQNMKTELITNVSHDLKTPLTSIITYVDLLKDQSLTDKQRAEYIDILDRKSQRLKVLIEDLFEMSKTTSKNITLNCQNIDLVTLNREVFVEFQDKLEEVALQVKSDYRAEKVVCYLDGQRTYRILENLYGNLIKYAMPNTRVYVTVEESDSMGVITIKNISSDELNFEAEHLMERFVRGDVSRNTEGSGLGLAIAKGLVEAQGGTMKIEIDGDLFKVIIKFPVSTVVEEKESVPEASEEVIAEPVDKEVKQPEQKEVSKADEEDDNSWIKQFYEEPITVEDSKDSENPEE